MNHYEKAEALFKEVDKLVPTYQRVGKLSRKPFEEYERAKGHHLKSLFGSELTIEKEVDIKLDLTPALQLSTEYSELAKDVVRSFQSAAAQKGVIRPENLRTSSRDEEERFFYELLGEVIFAKDGMPEKVKIKVGEKEASFQKNLSLSKILSKIYRILEMNDESLLKKIELLHILRSNVNQQSNIKGTLVLSIDPLDFLTMSMNNLGWDSCFSLLKDRPIGSTATMQSEDVFLAYIKTDKEFTLGDYRGNNNKLWRALIYYDGQYGFVGKHYPYNSDEVESEVKEMLEKILPKNVYFSDEIEIRTEPNWIYDDIYNGYKPKTKFLIEDETSDLISLNANISMIKKVYCMSTGELMDGYFEKWADYGLAVSAKVSEAMHCTDCARIIYGEGYEETICSDCQDEY